MFEPLPSRHLLDRELALRVDEVLPPAFTAETLPLLRAALEAGLAMAPPTADDNVEREERILPGLPGSPDVRVLFYRPRGLTGTAPFVLYLHGGGFVLGNADMGDSGTALGGKRRLCLRRGRLPDIPRDALSGRPR